MANRVTIELQVRGMSCAHCVKNVQGALEKVAGVSKATVDLDTEWALVTAEEWVKEEELVKAVEEAGYEARVAVAAR